VTPVSLQATTGVDALAGSTGADTFIAQMSATATSNTLGLLDTFDGGAGEDSLTVVNTTAAAVVTQLSAATVTNIEAFNYSASAGGNLDFDTAGSATAFNLTVLGTSDFADVRTSDTVTIVNGGAAMNSTFTYNTVNVAGDADAHTVAISSMTTGSELELSGAVETVTLDINGEASIAALVFDAATTAVNLDADGATTVATTLTGAGVKTYTVTGAGAVDLDAVALSTTVTAYNAAGSTGVQSILAGVSNITITGGSAADVIDMAATLTKDDTIDGGAGDDTLRVDLTSATAGATDLSISNVETLRLDNVTTSGAINMDNLAFSGGIRFDSGAATSETITLTDVAAAQTTFSFLGAGTASADLLFDAVEIDYDVTAAIASAELVINNGGAVADDITIGLIDINNVTKLTITATEIGAAAADELTIAEIEADEMTDLIVVADGEVIISDIDATIVDTIDFSDANGGVTVTALSAAAAAVAVTLGSGNDSFEVTATTRVMTVDLGAGNDTYVGDTGADTVTTGTGIDTVEIIGTTADVGNVITDFTVGAGGDVIDLTTNSANASAGGTVLVNKVGATVNLNGSGGAADVVDGGIMLIDDNVAALTAAGIFAKLTSGTNDLTATEDDEFYIAIDNGTDTVIALIDHQDANTIIALDEIVVLLTLEGVTDATTLTASNFADFV
jgi:RNase P/RNase MRP subunit p29